MRRSLLRMSESGQDDGAYKLPKKCFIPCCGNTNMNTEKIFVTVPTDIVRRRRWFKATGQSASRFSTSRTLSCCEDHFKLEEDAKNWMHFSLIGERLILKQNVVPHLFIQSPCKDTNFTQMPPSSRKRKMENVKTFQEEKKNKTVQDNVREVVEVPPNDVFIILNCVAPEPSSVLLTSTSSSSVPTEDVHDKDQEYTSSDEEVQIDRTNSTFFNCLR